MSRANTSDHEVIRRGDSGHYSPGVSGNPVGRPAVVKEIRDLARQHGPAAIARLVELTRSREGAVAITACRTLLDRGYGRPEQAIAIATIPFAGELTITNPIDAAAAYDRLMRGELSL